MFPPGSFLSLRNEWNSLRDAMNASEAVKALLTSAGIEVNGSRPWDPQVVDEGWYQRVLGERNLGLGESYMDGWWQCERLDEFFARILSMDIHREIVGNWRYWMRSLPAVLWNLQSRRRARMVAEQHYDLSNEFFFSFLDARRQYSCAFFEGTDDLEEAQLNKLELICRKLNLQPGDRLLDIGCGWGGLAKYAAETYGCEVTAVNVSKEQLHSARELCAGLPVSFVDEDYRRIQGKFDKIVSVGMFEHVGCKNYRAFMQVAWRCLEPNGLFLLHTIGNNKSVCHCDPWITRYIFPNGMLPSLAQISRAAEKRFVIEDVHNLGPHYDRTLMAWNQRFQAAWPHWREDYDERFKRMWEYYLLSCAGAFRARNIQLWQVLMTKAGTGTPQPHSRRMPKSVRT